MFLGCILIFGLPADNIIYVFAFKMPLVVHEEFNEQHEHHHPTVDGQQTKKHRTC